jgi:hypothetical protein
MTSGYGIGSRDSSPRLRRLQAVTGLGRGILARVYADDKRLRDWVAGFQPAFTQMTSGYGIGSRDSSPRLRRLQAVTGLGRGILARVYADNKAVTGLGRGIPARVYQITSGYGIGSRDSSPRLRRLQAVTGLGRGIPARVYADYKRLRIGSRDSSPRLRR